MATIKISELRPAGSELLQDSESFLNELSDHDLENVVGGAVIESVATQQSVSVASEVKNLQIYVAELKPVKIYY